MVAYSKSGYQIRRKCLRREEKIENYREERMEKYSCEYFIQILVTGKSDQVVQIGREYFLSDNNNTSGIFEFSLEAQKKS